MQTIPTRIQHRLDRLREAVNTTAHAPGSNSFNAIFDVFYELAEDKTFLDLSEEDPASDLLPTLEAIARAVSRDPKTTITPVVSGRVAAVGMRHGAVLLGDQPATWFLFEGDGRGMIGVHRKDGNFMMLRFTTVADHRSELPEHLGPMVKGIH